MHNRKRIWVLAVVAVLAAVVFFGRLYFLQIVSGEDYLERSAKRTSRTVTVTAPRGEILDRFGRPLVTNRMSFSVVFDATTWDKTRREEILTSLITLCDGAGQEYIDTLPVSANQPFVYTYNLGAGESSERAIAEYLKDRKWEPDTAAGGLVGLMAERYELKTTDAALLRKLCGVCYEMETRGFSKSQPYTFARDVDRELVTRIKEHSRSLPGVMIEVEPIREYKTKAAAHLDFLSPL